MERTTGFEPAALTLANVKRTLRRVRPSPLTWSSLRLFVRPARAVRPFRIPVYHDAPAQKPAARCRHMPSRHRDRDRRPEQATSRAPRGARLHSRTQIAGSVRAVTPVIVSVLVAGFRAFCAAASASSAADESWLSNCRAGTRSLTRGVLFVVPLAADDSVGVVLFAAGFVDVWKYPGSGPPRAALSTRSRANRYRRAPVIVGER